MKIISIAIFALILLSQSGCYDQTALSNQATYQGAIRADSKKREAAWAEASRVQTEDAARRKKAWDETEAMLQKDKDLTKRYEALLLKQEKQAERFDAILDKWESLSAPESK
jgi:hypothetical protein